MSTYPFRLILVFAAAFAAAFVYTQRSSVQDWISEIRKSPVPSAVAYPSAVASPSGSPLLSTLPTSDSAPMPTTTPTAVKQEINLDIPFVSQAPHKVWDIEHEDFCEEAAVLMAASYVKGDNSVTNIDVAEAALQKAKAWEIATFGYFESTTAVQTAQMLREHFGMTAVSVQANPSESQIKEWVTQGKAVVVPSAGRMLGNPNFKGAGPLYHMLVIKGYTADGRFITNDPGTRKGADYIYAPSVIMNAMHDWNGGDVNAGQKVVIVVG